ncbi:sentrin-specific protease 1-like isoform X1 [Biomphalaria glabrata]|nr:sentrin-specific protease 1-like isoform X1 [Biomphalaria glabrata]
MFKSLSDALRSLFSGSANDINKTPVGSKRKRNTDEIFSCDPDVQITRIEKRRRLESDSSYNSLFPLETFKRSAAKMAHFIKPKHSFQKDFNVQPVEPHSRWSERPAAERNGTSLQSCINKEEKNLEYKRFNPNHISGGSRGCYSIFQTELNHGLKNGVLEKTKQDSEQRHFTFFKRVQPCTITKCIRLNEKAEYQKLLQRQCAPLWSKKNSTPHDFSTCTAKDLDSSTISSRSSTCDTPVHSISSISSRRILPQGIYVSHSRLKEKSPVTSNNQSKLKDLETPYCRPYSVNKLFESHKVAENKKCLPEKVTIVTSDAIVILDDDDDDDEPARDSSNKDAQNHDSLDIRDRKCFQQSKYFDDKEMEAKERLRVLERERRLRLIEEEELKAAAYREKRRAHELSLEKKLKYQMRIFDDEPGVSEEIFREESEEEEEVLPVLTEEMDQVINYSLGPGNPNEVLSEAFRLQITRRDLATLKGLNWLNDEVINFYMNMLMERGEKSNNKVYAFNTFFYPKIMSGGHSAVKRWTKNVDIFSKKYIIIPVHLSMHWCLCIVNMEKKVITYFDSMGGKNPNCLRAVLNYLRDESVAKNQPQFQEKEWEIKHAEDNPQQMNGGDCGMFMCKYAEYITRGKEITFTQEHMPYFRRRMVYEIVSKKLLQ